jgi:hypothetical protein
MRTSEASILRRALGLAEYWTAQGFHRIVIALLLAGFGAAAMAQEDGRQVFPGYMDFRGPYFAVQSDADMVASASLDGALGTPSPELTPMSHIVVGNVLGSTEAISELDGAGRLEVEGDLPIRRGRRGRTPPFVRAGLLGPRRETFGSSRRA